MFSMSSSNEVKKLEYVAHLNKRSVGGEISTITITTIATFCISALCSHNQYFLQILNNAKRTKSIFLLYFGETEYFLPHDQLFYLEEFH